MTTLKRYFFEPVSALRVFIVVRCVLLLTAIESLRLAFTTLGNERYQLTELAIAHFDLLDRIQPAPSPSIRIGVALALALAATIGLRWPRRAVLALVAMLQSWTWSMSILDNFQHHYFVSIVLWLLVAMPHVTWADRRRQVEAGGFVLLAASIGITYVFTAIAKLDAVWTSGAVIRRLIDPLGIDLAAGGVAAIAWSVIGLELYVGASYLRARRHGSATTFVMLAAFHLSAEWILDLSIGAFSFYMVALAIAFQFPSIKKNWASSRVLQHDEDNDHVRLFGRLPATGPSLGAEHDSSRASCANSGRLSVPAQR